MRELHQGKFPSTHSSQWATSLPLLVQPPRNVSTTLIRPLTAWHRFIDKILWMTSWWPADWQYCSLVAGVSARMVHSIDGAVDVISSNNTTNWTCHLTSFDLNKPNVRKKKNSSESSLLLQYSSTSTRFCGTRFRVVCTFVVPQRGCYEVLWDCNGD